MRRVELHGFGLFASHCEAVSCENVVNCGHDLGQFVRVFTDHQDVVSVRNEEDCCGAMWFSVGSLFAVGAFS